MLAHVPDLNDFVAGLAILLKPSGVVTVEFPHLLRLIAERQFDTIYHEHFSYFSLLSVERVFAHHGLTVCRCRSAVDAWRLAAYPRVSCDGRDCDPPSGSMMSLRRSMRRVLARCRDL